MLWQLTKYKKYLIWTSKSLIWTYCSLRWWKRQTVHRVCRSARAGCGQKHTHLRFLQDEWHTTRSPTLTWKSTQLRGKKKNLKSQKQASYLVTSTRRLIALKRLWRRCMIPYAKWNKACESWTTTKTRTIANHKYQSLQTTDATRLWATPWVIHSTD